MLYKISADTCLFKNADVLGFRSSDDEEKR